MFVGGDCDCGRERLKERERRFRLDGSHFVQMSLRFVLHFSCISLFFGSFFS